MQEVISFWRNFINDPLRVSAVMPSGRALAAMMTREISRRHAPVIELGPGTGVFTQSLIDGGIPEDQLILVEYGNAFITQLEKRFPKATILNLDARKLNTVLTGKTKAGAVISGLPLLSMPRQAKLQIIRSAFSHLREDGVMYQFTYGVRAPIPATVLDRLGLDIERVGFAKANLPPASVFRVSRGG